MTMIRIRIEQIEQPTYSGSWAIAASNDAGAFGVLIGFSRDDDSSTIFIPESRFNEAAATLPPDLQAMFAAAAERLPAFKASQRRLLQ
jgi:hypothetical protein